MSNARIGLWVATLAALGLCARALMIDIVPGQLLIAALLLLAALVVAGLVWPEWEMFGEVLTHSAGSASALALCVEVRDRACCAQLLLLLQEHAARATFVFDASGRDDQENAESARAAGHEIALGVRAIWLRSWVSLRATQRGLFALLERMSGSRRESVRCVVLNVGITPPGLLHAASRVALHAVQATPLRAGRVSAGRIFRVCLLDVSPNSRQWTLVRDWLKQSRERGIAVLGVSEWAELGARNASQ